MYWTETFYNNWKGYKTWLKPFCCAVLTDNSSVVTILLQILVCSCFWVLKTFSKNQTITTTTIVLKFILYYYLLGGDLQISPDLNKKSKRFTPALYELCLQCSLVRSTEALWPMGDLGATEGSYPASSYLFLTLQLNCHNFCSHFPHHDDLNLQVF